MFSLLPSEQSAFLPVGFPIQNQLPQDRHLRPVRFLRPPSLTILLLPRRPLHRPYPSPAAIA